MPCGRPGIAVSPYRISGGISGVIALSAAAGVAYDPGYSCGVMFIEYPEDQGDVALIDALIDETYEAFKDKAA